jgi:hypothetical protein
MENEIKELEPVKAYKYLGAEGSHNIEHKNEEGKLKKEYVKTLRLILKAELRTEIKCKQ